MPEYHPCTPKHCCPPKGTYPATGVYYRVVRNNPPTADDFVIWILEPKNKHQLEENTRRTECPPYGMSMFSTKEAAKKGLDFFRRAAKGGGFIGVAEVALNENLGVMKQTGSNPEHYDLWPYVPCLIQCNATYIERE